jgi:carboxyl-terminal processing protease
VQSVYNLDGGYALKITTGKWFTPSGRSIQRERRLTPDGQFVEVRPDSQESDSARKARPVFKSAAGRTLYGGGGITPDVVVSPDTISSKEQQLRRALAPHYPTIFAAAMAIAEEQKGKVRPDFAINPAWRETVWQRLARDSVKVDRAIWDAGAGEVDRIIEERVAKVAFGDTTVRRRSLHDDNQLRQAISVLRAARTQQAVFQAAAGTGRK